MTPFEDLKLQVANMPSPEHSIVQLVAGIAAHVAATCGEKGAEIALALRTDAHAMAAAVMSRTKLDPAIAREEEAAKAAVDKPVPDKAPVPKPMPAGAAT